MAAEGIKLGMPPAKLGLVYSHTGLRRFIDAVGVPARASCSCSAATSPPTVALGWGLVNAVVAGDEVAAAGLSWATDLVANAPLSLTGNKRVIRELLDAKWRLDEQTERELIELRRACFASEDFKEGVRAFAEKRPARWQGR